MHRLRAPGNFGAITHNGLELKINVASDGTVHVADPAMANLLRTHGFTDVDPTPVMNNTAAALRKTLEDLPAMIKSGDVKTKAEVIATLRQHYGHLFTVEVERDVLSMFPPDKEPEPAVPVLTKEPEPAPAAPAKSNTLTMPQVKVKGQ